jgi:hypothetical protein
MLIHLRLLARASDVPEALSGVNRWWEAIVRNFFITDTAQEVEVLLVICMGFPLLGSKKKAEHYKKEKGGDRGASIPTIRVDGRIYAEMHHCMTYIENR